jgi:hypothetical protein
MHPNVKYELKELDRLFSTEEDRTNKQATQDATLGESIRIEVERIKKTLTYEVFNFEDERHLERYIQYHQQALIHLLDRSDALRQTEKNEEKEYYRIFYDAFDELLSFIERHFTKYFDQDAKAPEGYLSLARKDTRINIKKLQKVLAAKDADVKLVNLILHILRKIIDQKADKATTYRKVMYAKEVQKELFRLTESEDQTNINEELRQIMYYLNYNSIKVLTYHAHYISALLDNTETRTEKIEKLSLILKNINQAQVKPGIGYNLHASSLKNQLNEYISVEIEYHERLQQLTNRPPEPPSDNLLSGFKLKFEASVSQLAYILKVLIDTKIILNNNLSQVLHFLVRFVITKRSESISYGSIRSKFYNVETGTKESVRTMLASMIQYIDKS